MYMRNHDFDETAELVWLNLLCLIAFFFFMLCFSSNVLSLKAVTTLRNMGR